MAESRSIYLVVKVFTVVKLEAREIFGVFKPS